MPSFLTGRGAASNPPNRFEPLEWVPSGEIDPAEEPSVRTQVFVDRSKTILTRNDSPDVGAGLTLNPYRGCEHGCAYCYARPFHEYLGLSSGLDFETKIFAKTAAPELLREELLSRRWQPETIGFSGVTDAYQPIERSLGITRACLEVLGEFQNPFAIITKNHLVTRDIDVIAPMAKLNAAAVFVSVTSLDADVARRLEPRASTPLRRLQAIEQLAKAGIPVGVLVAPVVPGLTDHEMPKILAAVAEAGARWASYVVLRLPYQLQTLFSDWLEANYPTKKEKVLSRLRELRGGKLYDSAFGSRMRGEGVFADQLEAMFLTFSKKAGLNQERLSLRTDAFRRPEAPGQQLEFSL